MRQDFYYIRVSTENQNIAMQLDRVKLLGAKDENIFIDKDSGKNDDRKELQRLLGKLRQRLKDKAALAVIMHKNPDVSIKDIMKALQISQGSVYRCFEHEGYDYKKHHKNQGNKNASYKLKVAKSN